VGSFVKAHWAPKSDRTQIQKWTACSLLSPKGVGRVSVGPVSGLYQIVGRIPPAEDGECQYKSCSTVEQNDRIARESELMYA
jgi:hypothetical protein